jgi:hypothetical protein
LASVHATAGSERSYDVRYEQDLLDVVELDLAALEIRGVRVGNEDVAGGPGGARITRAAATRTAGVDAKRMADPPFILRQAA